MKTLLKTTLVLLITAHPLMAEVTESHKQKATQLIEMSSGSAEKVQRAMLEQVAETLPIKCPGFQSEFIDSVLKAVSVEKMIPYLIDDYTVAFTEKEIEEIIAFNSSATGQKALQVMPQLATKGGQVGQQLMQAEMNNMNALAAKYVNADGSCKE